MAGTLAASAAWPFQNEAIAAEVDAVDLSAIDPALVLWLEWKAICLEVEKLNRKQHYIEINLAQNIGYPFASIYLPGETERFTVFSLGQIREILGDDPGMTEIWTKAEDELAAHQALWDAADAKLNGPALKQQIARAQDSEETLVDALTDMPAMTMAGVAAKLDVVLREGESWEDSSDFPWPQIRSALDDMIRIERTMRPNILMPGSDRDGPYPSQYRSSNHTRIEKPFHAERTS
jgi:hypothetical protein